MEGRVAPIDLEPDEFRTLGHRLVDEIAALYASLPTRRVAPGASVEEVQALVGDGPLPDEGVAADELLREARELVIEHSLHVGHPRFMGYVVGSGNPIGALADLLASAVNPNVGGWQLSPVATEIERQTIRWLAELLGYPGDCGGLLVSGGNMANIVCFFAARAAAAPEARVAGVGGRRLRLYASTETHTWIQKAADMSGLGTDAIGWIEPGRDQRLDVAAVRERIAADRAAGAEPFLVVGNGGSVSTGAVDPLPELAELCREEGLWFHVDGAYGGFAACSPLAPDELRGLAEADSVAVDPHKWLYVPLEAGCALVRREQTLLDAFSYRPPYYHLEEGLNYFEYGPQNSRGFRALKVWLALRQAGRAGYEQMISDDIRLARRLEERVRAEPELETGPGGLSIATFRYVPEGESDPERLDQLNEELLSRLKAGGEVFVSNAVVDGRYFLRACIVNFRTSPADIDALPRIVKRVGAELYARALTQVSGTRPWPGA